MRKTLRVAIGVSAIAAGITTVHRLRLYVDSLLAEIDEALCRIGDDRFDTDAEPCICGSSEHQSTKQALLETPAWLDNAQHGTLSLAGQFQYDEADPLAVALKLSVDVFKDDTFVGRDSQSWSFARDLLDTALSTNDERLVGDGDVRAQYQPEGDELWIWLYDTSEVEHRVTVPAGPLRQFMATTFRIVPAGTETYDETTVDNEIQDLLGGNK